MNSNPDTVADAGQGLVDGVVHDLIDQVMQTANICAANVHSRATPNGLQPLEDLDIV